jgi:hypothetical protein
MQRSMSYGVIGVTAVAVAVGTASLAGVLPKGGNSAAEDRAVLVSTASSPQTGSFFRGYTRLVQTLPNARAGGESVSDSVVVGKVKSVEDSTGFVQGPPSTSPDKASARRTLFDDPLASWRTLRVTIDVDEVLAGPSVTTLAFDWPIMGSTVRGHDADAARRALLDLGTVAVISEALAPDAANLGIDRKLRDPGVNLAVVASDGSLSLPLIEGGEVAAISFLGGVDTVDELREQAKKPTWTWTPSE